MDGANTNFFRKYGIDLFKKGYDIIPITEGMKSPNITGWTKMDIVEADIDRWMTHEDRKGIGIRTKFFPAIDIDVTDEKIVMQVVKWCLEKFGATPVRVGRAPRCLLAFRTEEPFKKLRSAKYEDFLGATHQVEVLGQGQQYVAFATHPDTQKPYAWKGKSPIDVSPQDLPILTHEDAEAVIEYFESIALPDWKKEEKAEREFDNPVDVLDSIKPPVDYDLDKIKACLQHIDAYDYEVWVKVGMALYHQFDGALEGYYLWDAWSQKAENYNEEATEIRWPGFKHELEENPLTFRYVIHLAKESVMAEEKLESNQWEQEQESNDNPYGFTSVFDVKGKLAPPDWLIEGYIEKSTMGVMYAPSSSYKSFISIDMALCIATGKSWHGHKVNTGPVIYVAGEGHGGLPKRIEAWSQRHKVDIAPETPLVVTRCAPDLHSTKNAIAFSNQLGVTIEELGGCQLIIIDTMARAFGDGEENSNSDVMKFINNCTNVLRNRFNCAVLIIHHTGKADRATMRGASALRDALDFAHRLERNQDEPYTVKLIDEKEKDHDDNKELHLKGDKVIVGDFDNVIIDSLVFDEYVPDVNALTPQEGLAVHHLEVYESGCDAKDFEKKLVARGVCDKPKEAKQLIQTLVDKGEISSTGEFLSVF
jgi:hypothetical protein